MQLHILGPAGTFSHEAASGLFPDADLVFAANFDELFSVLRAAPGSIGLVPVENSLHGPVDETLDLLYETGMKLWKMHETAIRHSFGALDVSSVAKIASHPQALRQCRHWLHEHYPHAEHFPVSSTAFAVNLAAQDASIGAIAAANALTKAGLKIAAKDVEGAGNTTRFGIVSLSDPYAPGNPSGFAPFERRQMSVVLHPTDNRPGLLHRLLTPFKVYDVDLTHIESRPTGKKLGDYIFFVDFLGKKDAQRTRKVLEELKEIADVTVLGEW